MAETLRYLDKFTARKVQEVHTRLLATLPDSLEAWITQYIQLAVTGVRSVAVTQKIALHLARFLEYFQRAYGHDRISTCLKRDIVGWQKQMQADGLAHSPLIIISPLFPAFVPGFLLTHPTSFQQAIRRKGSENWDFLRWSREHSTKTRFAPSRISVIGWSAFIYAKAGNT